MTSRPTARLGAVVFGGCLFVLGWRHFEVFPSSWFWSPALGCGSALLCLLVSAFLCWGARGLALR